MSNTSLLIIFLILYCFSITHVNSEEENKENDEQKNSCSMVGLLGILIQVGLGALSFSVLIIKRYREKPKRPWRIWILDTSKQVISQLLAHFINLTISLALSYNKENSDECMWYFVTNVFDNTIGVFICIVMLKLAERQIKKKKRLELISGNYYKIIDKEDKAAAEQQKRQQQQSNAKNSSNNNEENIAEDLEQQEKDICKEHKQALLVQHNSSRVKAIQMIELPLQKIHANQLNEEFVAGMDAETGNNSSGAPALDRQDISIYLINYRAWILQLCIWNGIVIVNKCILFGIEMGLNKQLQNLSIFILGWIEAYPVLQLILVIVIVPVVMNGLAFWVQDNFLMKREMLTEEKGLIEQNQNDQKRQRKAFKKNQKIIFQEFENGLEHERKLKKGGNKNLEDDSELTQSQNQARRRSTFGDMKRFQFHEQFSVNDQIQNGQKAKGAFNKNQFEYFDRKKSEGNDFDI